MPSTSSWNPGHGFGASSEDAIKIAGGDFLEPEGDGLDARGASFVDGISGNFLGDAAADGNLSGRIGAAAGLAGVAENRFLNLIGANASAFHSGFGGYDAHVGCGHRSEGAAEFANRRSNCRENEDFVQACLRNG
jgi:hypothetical protein